MNGENGRHEMNTNIGWCRVLTCALLILMIGSSALAKDDKINPKEPGAYIKTDKGLRRLLPNIVFQEEGPYYIESNNPAHFFLKDIEYFVFFGKYNFQFLTLNPMVLLKVSPLGKPVFMFGKNVDVEMKTIGTDLYTVKSKKLLGRGYYSLWIEDSAWDFILD
jgi:hypothetical protein